MNLNVEETLQYSKELKDFVDSNLEDWMDIDIYVIPDHLALYSVSQIVKGSMLKLSAQNCFYEDKGAYTGEVSPRVLKELGCSYVLLGHPERITFGKEDTGMINKKIKAVLRNKMIPVLLIVEKEKKDKMSQTIQKMLDDLFPYLEGLSPEEINKIVIIYEPAWAIGTGSAAPIDHTYEVLAGLREALDQEYSKGTGSKQLFQYGGGVTLDSAREIMKLDNINGIGMGRAGLNLDFFTQAVKIAMELQRDQK
jgi:triosephosphate isomerase